MSVQDQTAAQQRRPPEWLCDPENLTLRMLRNKWQRLNTKNEHWMLCIVGEEGSGKSYTSLKIGELVDPDFSAGNVFFHPADVLERLRDGEYQTGAVWVLDEAGVGLGNRSWYEEGQVKLNQALQLIRNHNIGLIFTLPTLGGLDVQAEKRLQNVYNLTQKQDGAYVKGDWYAADVDRMGFSSRNGIWWDHPEINGAELETVSFTPPSDATIAEYEPAKREFQQAFYDETISDLRDEPDADDGPSVEDIVADLEREDHGIAPYLSWHGGHKKPYISKDELRAGFDLSHSDAGRLKGALQRSDDIDPEAAWSATND